MIGNCFGDNPEVGDFIKSHIAIKARYVSGLRFKGDDVLEKGSGMNSYGSYMCPYVNKRACLIGE